ncbi:serine/threonine-protein kinase 19-like [Dendronephthya gigantea]|uniref:serine/threonine-protein kinase 19-like n=1 Tax=Dendronephthya gigantea TaxID=151771 RepID=UPI00106AD891|nr:serine/threonine-protein kinase 19-like [Dendronephthya gigantea]
MNEFSYFAPDFSSKSAQASGLNISARNIGAKSEYLNQAELPSDTMAAILYIKSIFPHKVFGNLLPPIILKHQIYCIVKDKTIVDRQLNKLWQERKLQLFKLISGSDEFALVLMEDFKAHVNMKKNSKNSTILEKFLTEILPGCCDVSVSTKTLSQENKIGEADITVLVNSGLLQCRDVGSWWLGIPGAGVFMKNFTRGRQTILRMIRRRKFKEILQRDLESYKLNSKLGIQYHIYDIIGAELVQSIETTSGPLLRLPET